MPGNIKALLRPRRNGSHEILEVTGGERAATDLYQRLSHLIKSKDRPEERMHELERLAYSSLYSKAEAALTAVLTEITGGTFNFAWV